MAEINWLNSKPILLPVKLTSNMLASVLRNVLVRSEIFLLFPSASAWFRLRCLPLTADKHRKKINRPVLLALLTNTSIVLPKYFPTWLSFWYCFESGPFQKSTCSVLQSTCTKDLSSNVLFSLFKTSLSASCYFQISISQTNRPIEQNKQ